MLSIFKQCLSRDPVLLNTPARNILAVKVTFFGVLQDIVGRGLNKLYGLWDELGIDENGRKVDIFFFFLVYSFFRIRKYSLCIRIRGFGNLNQGKFSTSRRILM
jgi:hypothetical protein